MIAAIEVTFTDGSTQTIVSDDTWLANNATSGFESIFYDDSSWPTAYELATADTSPWNTPASPPPPSSLSLASSQWIWTDEISGPGGDAPVGNRTFRKDISIAGKVPATGGTIIISTDNVYTLYINGQEIGSYDNWEIAQSWTFTLDTPSRNIVVAVNAENTGGPAGVIAALDLTVAIGSCSTYVNYVTDSSWVYNLTVPAGFQYSNFSDSGWPNAVEEGLWGVGPWGEISTQNA